MLSPLYRTRFLVPLYWASVITWQLRLRFLYELSLMPQKSFFNIVQSHKIQGVQELYVSSIEPVSITGGLNKI